MKAFVTTKRSGLQYNRERQRRLAGVSRKKWTGWDLSAVRLGVPERSEEQGKVRWR